MTMTNFELRKRARKLWKSPYNQQKWVRAVLILGDKWLLAKKVERITPMNSAVR